MLAPQLKKKVDQLWNRFWAAGITNPLVAIEQITYLLFLKRLEVLDDDRVKKGKPSIYVSTAAHPKAEECRWSKYICHSGNPRHMNEVVFPWLRQLESQLGASNAPANGIEAIGSRMSDAYFQLDPNKGAILTEAIATIDQLFARVDNIGPAADIMGDTFEYLLSEIATAGKNGQFRTPRHLIRFMVELLDPQPGERIIDPAAGTGGFLFSAQQYLLKQHTSPGSLRIEWDGTPHRVYGDQLTPEEEIQAHDGHLFVGLDNDRTMVRIGWMNLILHGLQDPQIHQRDSLGKPRIHDKARSAQGNAGDAEEASNALDNLLEPETYKIVLANPPFTGTVDADDLDPDIAPAGKKKGALTNKSELLFVWRMLALLDMGGRCAVIVPEGVLFGGTEAHQKLRQELLTEHQVDAVISLPPGAFQPYTGVKTSVLVFRKLTAHKDRNKWQPSQWPQTRSVWFYEVADEAYTPDAKRVERKGKDNDLWDALEKFRRRDEPEADSKAYHQPGYWEERWRILDGAARQRSPDGYPKMDNGVWNLEELHGLPRTPKDAEAKIIEACLPGLKTLLEDCVVAQLMTYSIRLSQETNARRQEEIAAEWLATGKKEFRKLFNADEIKGLFETDATLDIKSIGLERLKGALKAVADTDAELRQTLERAALPDRQWRKAEELQADALAIAREFAKLDGYDVMLRGLESPAKPDQLAEAKSWTAPVRVYVRDDEWQGENDENGSHGPDGQPRPAYFAWVANQVQAGRRMAEFLDPDCIEARDWNLSAGQYKPFSFADTESEVDVAALIRGLQAKEQGILDGLGRLLAMVEGRE